MKDDLNLDTLTPGQVVMDSSGHAWQKQDDGSWMFAGSEAAAPMSEYGPFTLLQPGQTPWEFPAEVEDVLTTMADDGTVSAFYANAVRAAMAKARLEGSFVPSRTDYEVASQALCDAAEILREEGHTKAAKRLRKMCREVMTPHDE